MPALLSGTVEHGHSGLYMTAGRAGKLHGLLRACANAELLSMQIA